MVKSVARHILLVAAVLLFFGTNALVTLTLIEQDNLSEVRRYIQVHQADFVHRFLAGTLIDHSGAIRDNCLPYPELLPTVLIVDEDGNARGGAVPIRRGLLVTAAHCVVGHDVVWLTWRGQVATGVVVYRSDPDRDVAIISLVGSLDLRPPRLIDGREGLRVWTRGYPYGRADAELTVDGYLGQKVCESKQVTSLPTYVGFSGCGVYDARGHLVGICNSLVKIPAGPLPPYSRLSLMTPSEVIEQVLAEWLAFGQVEPCPSAR